MSKASFPTLSKDKDKYYYEQTVYQINREESLINWRITAVLTINGFLFAAIALSFTDQFSLSCKWEFVWFTLLPLIGLLINLGGLAGVIAAYIAIWHLKQDLRARLTEGINIGQPYPRPFGNPVAYWFGIAPSIAIPFALAGFWCFVLIWF